MLARGQEFSLCNGICSAFFQVTIKALQQMDETLLKELAPALGDQVLLRTFIKKSANPKKKIRLSLVERLHKRMAEYKGGKAFNNVASGSQSSTLPKSNHLKRERNIEIGWMHYDQLEKEYKHVRTISGGGTCKQNVPKSWTKYDILQRAKELFFPNGVSTYIGSIDSVDIDVADYQQQPLDNTLTIESIFSITGLSKLRFYLLTQEKSPSATPHKRRRTKVLTPMAFDSHASLMSRYQSLVPSNKTVKSLLIFPETMSEEETTSSHFLKKFVGGLDDRSLHRFLRFCTGCDLFLGHTIKVNFSQLTGLQRRPIAHTCTYELDIACNYDNYPEFRDEFAKILNMDQWEMDYI